MTRNRTFGVAAAVGVALLAGAAAHAEHGGEWMLRMFDEADANHDGLLSKQELTTHMESRRERGATEFESRFTAADSDGSGALSRAETDASLPMLSEHFGNIDGDDDGQLTKAELADAHRHRGFRGAMHEKLRAADSNEDGKLDLAEAQNASPRLSARFADIDADDDGYVTPDELKRAFRQ